MPTGCLTISFAEFDEFEKEIRDKALSDGFTYAIELASKAIADLYRDSTSHDAKTALVAAQNSLRSLDLGDNP